MVTARSSQARVRVAPQAAGAACVRVLLVAPFGPNGGGMGRMMAYLAAQEMPGGFRFEMLESRGAGPAILSAWPLLRAAWTIWRRARGHVPVLLHLNVAERGSVLRKGLLLHFGRALGVRTILHLHAAELPEFYDRVGPFGQARVRGVFRGADICIVLGEGMAGWLTARLSVPERRIAVLRNGVPAPAVLPFPALGTRPMLLFLGNLQVRKGLGELLEALGSDAVRNRDFTLTIAGGGDAAPWREAASDLGLAGRVSFTGWVARKAVTALLARAAMLVLPSHHEGLPLVLLEAASMGVPCITTPVGAIGEVFTDGETALLVPPGNSAALAAAIVRMLDDALLRARIGRRAHALYERSLSMAAFTEGLGIIYEKAGAWPGPLTPRHSFKRGLNE